MSTMNRDSTFGTTFSTKKPFHPVPTTRKPQAAGLGFFGGRRGNRTPDLIRVMDAL